MCNKVLLAGKFELYLLFVVEHRSSLPQKHLPIQFQLLRYLLAKLNAFFDALEADLNQPVDEANKAGGEATQSTPTVFPLPLLFVLYNGEQQWQVLSLKDYYRQLGAPEELINLVLEVPYIVYDLSSQSQAAIDATFGDVPELRAMLQSMKAIWQVDAAPELINDILRDDDKLQSRVIQAILNYIRTAFKDKTAFETVLKETKGGDMIGVYNQDHRDSEARGLFKGRQEGRQEGRKESYLEIAQIMLKDNEPIDKIMRYTHFTLEEIEAIKAKL